MTQIPEDQTTALLLILNSPVNPETGCWEWQGSRFTSGYGRVHCRGKTRRTHRLSHETFVGPIPEGLVIDHVRARGCRVRHCANPAHLEPVTNGENIRRGMAPSIVTQRTGVCQRGHVIAGDNLKVMSGGRRTCRECHNASQRRSYQAERPTVQRREDVCPQGHSVTGENAVLRANGYVRCGECQRAATRRYRAKRKSGGAA